MARGKLIAIEGSDGSGKATQTARAAARATAEGIRQFTYSFPQYHRPTGIAIKAMLGKLGNPERYGTVTPWMATVLFAIDRLDATPMLRSRCKNGINGILDRFKGSNLAHQGCRFQDRAERHAFYRTAMDFESRELGVPDADLNVILHVPAATRSDMIDKRGIAKDAYELDVKLQCDSESAYLELAELYPDKFKVVQCMHDGKLLSPDDVHELVWREISPLLK